MSAAPMGSSQQMGLPAGFGDQMFANMQAANQAQNKNLNQQTLDNSRNPAMSGVAQAGINSNNQNSANQAMQDNTQAQLTGAQAGFQANQAAQGRAFSAQQATQAQGAQMAQLQAQMAGQQALQAQGYNLQMQQMPAQWLGTAAMGAMI